ncbi:hypothetical protein B9Z07_18370 [Burkholderia cenocepacia]|uniref:Uncharacterized protein n=1 Tax=Burkholderia cenocepacia TaxID=95486 RepID=A0A427NZE2_9BURK|nr:hypothetical protein B9Z07_18370 [Burkholderia cenocepacia]PNO76154.1 hypothetical protein DK10_004155 [Burkholderia cenocepacia]PRE37448.1 hypothetical protein C6P63_07945 [Burkholderia cenocepacia]RQV59578.1 hypothetical protein DF020_10825 [Burkholderia cenocepacia]RSC13009.1 hypothetical protein EGT41_06445 [Burkholderia cenocepacia]
MADVSGRGADDLVDAVLHEARLAADSRARRCVSRAGAAAVFVKRAGKALDTRMCLRHNLASPLHDEVSV